MAASMYEGTSMGATYLVINGQAATSCRGVGDRYGSHETRRSLYRRITTGAEAKEVIVARSGSCESKYHARHWWFFQSTNIGLDDRLGFQLTLSRINSLRLR